MSFLALLFLAQFRRFDDLLLFEIDDRVFRVADFVVVGEFLNLLTHRVEQLALRIGVWSPLRVATSITSMPLCSMVPT